jgi:Zn finger protein HypA/HybF involved in hydrogenase expression
MTQLIPPLITTNYPVYCSCHRCGEHNYNDALRGYRFCKPCYNIVRDIVTHYQLYIEAFLKERGLM